MTETIINPNAEWEDKCWGRTRCVVSSPFYSRHELEVVAGGYCSFHYHQNRGNRFIVPMGSEVIVRVVQAFGWKLYTSVVRWGRVISLDIPALVPHQFQVERSGALIEEYWSDRMGEVEDEDIDRLSVGGFTAVGRIACERVSIFHSDGTRWEGRDAD